jgi:plastocyanin
MNNKYFKALPVFGLAACIVFAGCAGAGAIASTVQTSNPPATEQSTTPASLPASAPTSTTAGSTADSGLPPAENNPTIVIGVDGVFYPMTLSVSAGTKVDFKNEDCCNYHKIFSDAPFTMNMDPLALIPFNFDKPGTYKFWLEGVQWVYGTVTVT